MRRRRGVLLLLVLLGACARLRPPPPSDGDDARALLARADQLAREGSPHAARALYRKVVRQNSDSAAAADALYALGRLYADPSSSLHDWEAAHTAFARLASEHPDSPHADEARAWQAALSELLNAQADANKLRADLERLKQLDMEQERHR